MHVFDVTLPDSLSSSSERTINANEISLRTVLGQDVLDHVKLSPGFRIVRARLAMEPPLCGEKLFMGPVKGIIWKESKKRRRSEFCQVSLLFLVLHWSLLQGQLLDLLVAKIFPVCSQIMMFSLPFCRKSVTTKNTDEMQVVAMLSKYVLVHISGFIRMIWTLSTVELLSDREELGRGPLVRTCNQGERFLLAGVRGHGFDLRQGQVKCVRPFQVALTRAAVVKHFRTLRAGKGGHVGVLALHVGPDVGLEPRHEAARHAYEGAVGKSPELEVQFVSHPARSGIT